MKIILASGSPRRYDLLKQIGWDVEVRSLPFSEVETVNEATEQLIQLRKNFLSADSTQQDVTFCEKDEPGRRSSPPIPLSYWEIKY